ncbi:hypothetical protein C8Q80DRAFT_1266684 [Daedaleopsis nitida]|nr:hypothetical protein C8Q80DRAFT_1266684 [Daedaleopsis nitida]
MPQNALSLFTLHYDVLVLIFEELRPRRNLRALSGTCRWLRRATTPTLFRACTQEITSRYDFAFRFITRDFWPYVRSLQLVCYCIDSDQTRYVDFDVAQHPGEEDDIVCVAYRHPLVEEALRGMPYLSELSMAARGVHNHGHGISSRLVSVVLSLPQLTLLDLFRVYCSPKLPEGESEHPQYPTSTSLTVFKYRLLEDRRPWRLPGEEKSLDLLVRAACGSLERLSLPAEPAPILTISLLQWPRLRVLRLYGERWITPNTPIIVLFSNLAALEELVLNLVEPVGVDARAVWPPGTTTSFPWPLLQRLSLSHPSAHDMIYSHLPPTLRTLSLRPWEHRCMRMKAERLYEERHLRPAFPFPEPSTITRILREIQHSYITELEIEYQVDETASKQDEQDMFHTVTAQLPHLTSLEIHRCRSTMLGDVPVREIARALRPLSSLRVAKLNFNFPECSPPRYLFARCSTERILLALETATVNATAFVQECSSSLQEVWMLRNNEYWLGTAWYVYTITRDVPGAKEGVEVVCHDSPMRYVIER